MVANVRKLIESGIFGGAASTLGHGSVIPTSIHHRDGCGFGIARDDQGRRTLLFVGPPAASERFVGELQNVSMGGPDQVPVRVCSTSNLVNYGALKERWPEYQPKVPAKEGLSFGAGCRRRARAARGHYLAWKKYREMQVAMAQQSLRELLGTGVDETEVIPNTAFALAEMGYALDDMPDWFADADHRSTTEQIGSAADAGYTMFTCDPGEVVWDEAVTLPTDRLQVALDGLQWGDANGIPVSQEEFFRLVDKTLKLPTAKGNRTLAISREQAARAVLKYGQAIPLVIAQWNTLLSKLGPGNFALELSVDEGNTFTGIHEVAVLFLLFQKLGIELWSIAPRYPFCRFQKGIDVLFDSPEDKQKLYEYMLMLGGLCRLFNVKNSVHSGSDKLGSYAMLAELCHGLLHVKTAGTVWLMELLYYAYHHPALFRKLAILARDGFAAAASKYANIIGGRPENVKDIDKLHDENVWPDDSLFALLGLRNMRQPLHVAYADALKEHELEMNNAIAAMEGEYTELVAAHMRRHFRPMVEGARRAATLAVTG